MASHIGGIDHAIIGVRDLEQARATFERLGFCPTPRGRHVGRGGGQGAGEHCLMFADGYVELRGIVDPAGHDQYLERFLAAGEGCSRWRSARPIPTAPLPPGRQPAWHQRRSRTAAG